MKSTNYFSKSALAAAVACLLLGNKGAHADVVQDFGPFQGSYVLEESIGYKVSWGVADGAITLLLESSSTGWLGFGFGEPTSGSMIGADIVTYEPSDDSVTDRHVDWSAYPISPFPTKDGCQNWELLTAVTDNSGDTPVRQVVVKRSLQTEDDNDRDVTSGPTRIVFAYGSNDHSSVRYHNERRGAAAIDFFKGNDQFERYISGDEEWLISPLPDETSNATFVMPNYVVPTNATTYASMFFNVSEHKNKGVIAIEPVINEDTKDLVHHMIVHVCTSLVSTVPSATGSLFGTPVCPTMQFGWAVGGGALILPSDASFTGTEYLALEIHYNNAAQDSGRKDSSGFRLHYSTKPRARVASMMAVGDPFIQERFRRPIASSNNSYWFESQCTSACTQHMANPSVEVVGSFLHMHSYGKQVWSAHYSSVNSSSVNSSNVLEFNGITNEIEFWQFEFQQTTQVNYTLSRGDAISVNCVYDTSKSTANVTFGTASEDEMCMEFLLVVGDVPESISTCGGSFFGQSICQVDGDVKMVELSPSPVTYPREVSFGSSEKVCTEEPTGTKVPTNPTDSPADAASSFSLGVSIVAALGVVLHAVV